MQGLSYCICTQLFVHRQQMNRACVRVRCVEVYHCERMHAYTQRAVCSQAVVWLRGCSISTYGGVQVLGTTWEGPTLNIIVEGWLCRLVTEELEEDYEVLDITSRVECIPPRVRYEYVPAKFRKKYITNFQFQSPECKKVRCLRPPNTHATLLRAGVDFLTIRVRASTQPPRPSPSRGSAGRAGVSTRPARSPHPWGATGVGCHGSNMEPQHVNTDQHVNKETVGRSRNVLESPLFHCGSARSPALNKGTLVHV